MKYEDYIEKFNKENDRRKRYQYKIEAMKKFKSQFDKEDFPRNKRSYSDWVEYFNNADVEGDLVRQGFIRQYTRNNFPNQFDIEDFPYTKKIHISSYKSGLNSFYKQKTARMRYHIKTRLKKMFPKDFNKSDFNDQRKERSKKNASN